MRWGENGRRWWCGGGRGGGDDYHRACNDGGGDGDKVRKGEEGVCVGVATAEEEKAIARLAMSEAARVTKAVAKKAEEAVTNEEMGEAERNEKKARGQRRARRRQNNQENVVMTVRAQEGETRARMAKVVVATDLE